jgi:hypothetical protein
MRPYPEQGKMHNFHCTISDSLATRESRVQPVYAVSRITI